MYRIRGVSATDGACDKVAFPVAKIAIVVIWYWWLWGRCGRGMGCWSGGCLWLYNNNPRWNRCCRWRMNSGCWRLNNDGSLWCLWGRGTGQKRDGDKRDGGETKDGVVWYGFHGVGHDLWWKFVVIVHRYGDFGNDICAFGRVCLPFVFAMKIPA